MRPQCPEPLIHLNVGGTLFTTTAATLTNPRAGDSLLSRLVESTLPTRKDGHGRIFIDRDGTRFAIVLNYLRNGTVHVVDGLVPCAGGGVALTAMVEEAKFYGLEQLGHVLGAEVRRLELEECLVGWGDARNRAQPAVAPAREQTQAHLGGGVQRADGGLLLELNAEF